MAPLTPSGGSCGPCRTGPTFHPTPFGERCSGNTTSDKSHLPDVRFVHRNRRPCALIDHVEVVEERDHEKRQPRREKDEDRPGAHASCAMTSGGAPLAFHLWTACRETPKRSATC